MQRVVVRLCQLLLLMGMVLCDGPTSYYFMTSSWAQSGGPEANPMFEEQQPPSKLTVEQEQTALTLGRLLRCPVCQGMPIGESPAPMAQDMMRRVRSMLLEGQSEQAISAYFVARYGDWVLLEPAAEGFNLLLWWLPPLIGVFGLVGLGWRQRVQQRHLAALPRVSATDPLLPTELPQEQYEQLAATLQQKVNE